MAAGEDAGQPAASLSTDTASRLVKRSPWNAPAPPRSPLPPAPPRQHPSCPFAWLSGAVPSSLVGAVRGGGCLAGVSRPHRPWPHPWCGAPLRSPGAQPRDRVLARLLHVDAASVGLTVSLHVVLPPLVRRRHAAPHPTWGGGGGGHESPSGRGGGAAGGRAQRGECGGCELLAGPAPGAQRPVLPTSSEVGGDPALSGTSCGGCGGVKYRAADSLETRTASSLTWDDESGLFP